jgi:hypothetical protein
VFRRRLDELIECRFDETKRLGVRRVYFLSYTSMFKEFAKNWRTSGDLRP